MKFKELFIFWLILWEVLGQKFQVLRQKFQCQDYEIDILRSKKGKVFFIHSYSKFSNHSFEQDSLNRVNIPLSNPLKHLMTFTELMNNSKYLAHIHSVEQDLLFDFKAMRVDVQKETVEYCGFKQTGIYFVLVIKNANPEKMNSIILYGCDMLTSGHITVLIIESDHFTLKSETISNFFQFRRKLKFQVTNATNEGFCMCSLSPKYVADCTGEDGEEANNRINYNIDLFWIIVGLIITLLIIVYTCF
ncbi:unnamed protein product [Diamesa serratosioi]